MLTCDDRLNRTVTQDSHCERKALAQLCDRRRGSVFLREAEERAAEHDDENDGGIDPIANEEGDGRAKDQDQDERARELVEQQPDCRDFTPFLNDIRAVALEAFGGLCRGKTLGTRGERGEQIRRIAAPVRVLSRDPRYGLIAPGHQDRRPGHGRIPMTITKETPAFRGRRLALDKGAIIEDGSARVVGFLSLVASLRATAVMGWMSGAPVDAPTRHARFHQPAARSSMPRARLGYHPTSLALWGTASIPDHAAPPIQSPQLFTCLPTSSPPLCEARSISGLYSPLRAAALSWARRRKASCAASTLSRLPRQVSSTGCCSARA